MEYVGEKYDKGVNKDIGGLKTGRGVEKGSARTVPEKEWKCKTETNGSAFV